MAGWRLICRREMNAEDAERASVKSGELHVLGFLVGWTKCWVILTTSTLYIFSSRTSLKTLYKPISLTFPCGYEYFIDLVGN